MFHLWIFSTDKNFVSTQLSRTTRSRECFQEGMTLMVTIKVFRQNVYAFAQSWVALVNAQVKSVIRKYGLLDLCFYYFAWNWLFESLSIFNYFALYAFSSPHSRLSSLVQHIIICMVYSELLWYLTAIDNSSTEHSKQKNSPRQFTGTLCNLRLQVAKKVLNKLQISKNFEAAFSITNTDKACGYPALL